MTGVVTVACKLPNGHVLRLFDMIDVTETGPLGSRTVKRAKARTGTVTLIGVAAPYGQPKLLTGGYALTHNVDKDFFDEWMRQNAESPLVKNGMIFANVAGKASGEAREKAEIKSGLEPMKQKNDPRMPRSRNPNLSDIEKADVSAAA